MKSALITGCTGMDGSHLAELLSVGGYKVFGLIRRSSTPNLWRVQPLIDSGLLTLIEGDLLDQSSLMKAIEASEPDEVYNLAAQSFVGTSWTQPTLTAEITGLGALRVLEAVRLVNSKIRIYQASSSELFGSSAPPQDELTPFHPRSPYGVSKLFAHWSAINYRESYGIYIACGVLFNHESPRRGIEFVTKKITNGVTRIKYGLQKELRLGNLNVLRDWSHAKDMMWAAWLMLQRETPEDYVCGSGESHTVREFCDLAFSHVGLDYRDYVVVDPSFFRPAEVNHLQADPSRIKSELGWEPKYSFRELVEEMVDADMERVGKSLVSPQKQECGSVPLFI